MLDADCETRDMVGLPSTSTGRDTRMVEASWNVMAHAQKPDFVFRRNRRVHLNLRWYQFSRLLAAGVCASVVVMLDTPCSEVVWRVLHSPSLPLPCVTVCHHISTGLYLRIDHDLHFQYYFQSLSLTSCHECYIMWTTDSMHDFRPAECKWDICCIGIVRSLYAVQIGLPICTAWNPRRVKISYWQHH